MPRHKKISPAKGYHKVISTGNGEFASFNKVVQAFGCTGSGRGLLRHSINEPQGPREYERMEFLPARPPSRPKPDPLLTELSNLNPDSGSSHHDFESDARSDISHVDKVGNTRSWIDSAGSFIPGHNYHGTGSKARYDYMHHYHPHSRDLDIMMSRLEYQLQMKERQLAFATSMVEQQNRFISEEIDVYLAMPAMRRKQHDDIENKSFRGKSKEDKSETAKKSKKKQKKTKADSAERKSPERLESEVNNGSSEIVKTESNKDLETEVPVKSITLKKENQYEKIKLECLLKTAEEVCKQGCPFCYIERFSNLEEYGDHIKQKSHIDVKKLARERSDTIIKEMVYNHSNNCGLNTENGLEVIQSVKGYYCQLCQLFFQDELEAKVNHCETEIHNVLYKNLTKNSEAIEKALADEMIKTQNQNLNGTEDITTQQFPLFDSKLSQDIRDLCLDKLEEVIAEKQQMSMGESDQHPVMFMECSDLEKTFFAGQEVRGDNSAEVYPSEKEKSCSKSFVETTNICSISPDTLADLEQNMSALPETKTSKSSILERQISMSNTGADYDMKYKYYGTSKSKNEPIDKGQENSNCDDAHTLINLKDRLTPTDAFSLWNMDMDDISLPYTINNTGAQYDMKCKYGDYENRDETRNEVNCNSDDDHTLTSIKDKASSNETFTTVSLNYVSSPELFETTVLPSDSWSNYRKKCSAYKGLKQIACCETDDEHEEKASKIENLSEMEKSKTGKGEDLNADVYEADSISVASSHSDGSDTDNVDKASTTNSFISDAEIDSVGADDFNDLDDTLKEDQMCYECLKEFEASTLSPDRNIAECRAGGEVECCSESNVVHTALDGSQKIFKYSDLVENNSVIADDLQNRSNSSVKSSPICCDISLYSDGDKPDKDHIVSEQIAEYDPVVNDSDLAEQGTHEIINLESKVKDVIQKETSSPKNINNITVNKEYNMSVQKDLNLIYLPSSTSFNYTTALDYDINDNAVVELNDFEDDSLVLNEGISSRQTMTQTCSKEEPYDSSFTVDANDLVTEVRVGYEVKEVAADGVEDNRHQLQDFENNNIKTDVFQHNSVVTNAPSLLDPDFGSSEDLDGSQMSEEHGSVSSQTTQVNCDALIQVIDSVIGKHHETTEQMIWASCHQSLETPAGKLDIACGGDDAANSHTMHSGNPDQISDKNDTLPEKNQFEISNIVMLPGFSDNKDDSGITDDYDEGYVCPRNSPHLWSKLLTKHNQSSLNTQERDTQNIDLHGMCLDRENTEEQNPSQKVRVQNIGLLKADSKEKTSLRVCSVDLDFTRTSLESGKGEITSHMQETCDGNNNNRESAHEDLFTEECSVDIILQVHNSDIAVDTSETLSIDICGDTSIESSFIDDQTTDGTSEV